MLILRGTVNLYESRFWNVRFFIMVGLCKTATQLHVSVIADVWY